MNRRWKVVGINFDHMHMGDLLRLVHDHPEADIAGICDAEPERMAGAVSNFAISPEAVFTDPDACIETTRPDLVILCPATAHHADWVERVARHKVPILVEKPFAASIAEADRMIRATEGQLLAINWPLAWYPPHVTTKRLIDEGLIGDVTEVHYCDGNRGPLHHLADKLTREPTLEDKRTAWWYRAEAGGGSLLDYLGYGVTLGTWFQDGRAPVEVTSTIGGDPSLEVDEHSITVARYAHGLSKYETRWGTFSDPWVRQPQPKCGFVVVGSKGTISSYDYEDHVTVQTEDDPDQHDIPVDVLAAPRSNPIEYVLHCLATGEALSGPLDPKLCRVGQQIVDTALASARAKRTLELLA